MTIHPVSPAPGTSHTIPLIALASRPHRRTPPRRDGQPVDPWLEAEANRSP